MKAALAFAAENDVEVSVRGGGHSVAGASLTDGRDEDRPAADELGLGRRRCPDNHGRRWRRLEGLRRRHPAARIDGNRRAGLDHRGRGLSLGGGSGWLERKFGLACDNLLSLKLVTADGRTVVASEDENPELFWARSWGKTLSGSGIATELTFRLHEMPAFTLALLLWPPENGPELARAYRSFIEVCAGGGWGRDSSIPTGPPEEFVPAHLQGQLACAILITYAGPEAEAREAMSSILALEPAGRDDRRDALRKRSSACSTTHRASATTGPPST